MQRRLFHQACTASASITTSTATRAATSTAAHAATSAAARVATISTARGAAFLVICRSRVATYTTAVHATASAIALVAAFTCITVSGAVRVAVPATSAARVAASAAARVTIHSFVAIAPLLAHHSVSASHCLQFRRSRVATSAAPRIATPASIAASFASPTSTAARAVVASRLRVTYTEGRDCFMSPKRLRVEPT